MPCYNPVTGYRAKSGRDSITGKWPVVFNRDQGYVDMPISLPCGRCRGCRLERSRQWAMRCVHEAMYQLEQNKDNCFITLTYNNKHLPPGGTLVKRDFQLFMKRLRKKYGSGIRFFHCGEYGSKNFRPHYHACIFGFKFQDLTVWKVEKKGKLLITTYRSEELENLWKNPETGEQMGFCTVGEVTFESAAYVARYVLKKWLGTNKEDHPVDWKTGEILETKIAEYTTMSRKDGIGKKWFEKYKNDVFPHDRVIMRGKKLRPPKYYDAIYDIENHETMENIKRKRRSKAVANAEKKNYNSLRAFEAQEVEATNRLIRGLENDT